MNRTEIAAPRRRERTGMSTEFRCFSIKIARISIFFFRDLYMREERFSMIGKEGDLCREKVIE